MTGPRSIFPEGSPESFKQKFLPGSSVYLTPLGVRECALQGLEGTSQEEALYVDAETFEGPQDAPQMLILRKFREEGKPVEEMTRVRFPYRQAGLLRDVKNFQIQEPDHPDEHDEFPFDGGSSPRTYHRTVPPPQYFLNPVTSPTSPPTRPAPTGPLLTSAREQRMEARARALEEELEAERQERKRFEERMRKQGIGIEGGRKPRRDDLREQ